MNVIDNLGRERTRQNPGRENTSRFNGGISDNAKAAVVRLGSVLYTILRMLNIESGKYFKINTPHVIQLSFFLIIFYK